MQLCGPVSKYSQPLKIVRTFVKPLRSRDHSPHTSWKSGPDNTAMAPQSSRTRGPPLHDAAEQNGAHTNCPLLTQDHGVGDSWQNDIRHATAPRVFGTAPQAAVAVGDPIVCQAGFREHDNSTTGRGGRGRNRSSLASLRAKKISTGRCSTIRLSFMVIDHGFKDA